MEGISYQKCTVLSPMGLFHMRFSHGSAGPAPVVSPEAVDWKRRDAGRRKDELKLLALRKAGREARKRDPVDAIVVLAVAGREK